MGWKAIVDSLTAGIPTSDKRFLGLKISTVGFLVVMGGAVIFVTLSATVGKYMLYSGAVIFFLGSIVHTITLLKHLK